MDPAIVGQHTRRSSDHARAMEDAFIDWFALAGPVAAVRPRFERLAALGLDFLYLVSASADTPRDVARASLETLSSDILPLLHAA